MGNFHRLKKTCFALWDMALSCACVMIDMCAGHIQGSSEKSATSGWGPRGPSFEAS